MLIMAGLPDSCWAEAFCAAAHVRNRTSVGGNDGMTPYERLFGERPNIAHLRVFGAPCYARVRTPIGKMQPRAQHARLIGYECESFDFLLRKSVQSL
jgi:hypothetical protein